MSYPLRVALLAAATAIALYAPFVRAVPGDASADPALLTEVQVTAHRLDEARNALMPETGTSAYRLGIEDLKNLPLGESTPLNDVLLRAPGVTQDSFGQLHVRGDHANLQYRINDVVIPESIALFGQALNPRFASQISLLTGALPAQYGYRTAGVVDIHTKGSDYEHGGSLNVMAGSQQHREANGEVSGTAGALSYYATGGYLRDEQGIENPLPTSHALHDHTEQWNGFGYLSYVLASEARISLMGGASDDGFQIPVVPGQIADFAPPAGGVPPSAALDQRQREGNRFAILSYENAPSAPLHFQVALYDRFTNVHYRPDPLGDLAYTGAAGDVARSNSRWGVQADASLKAGDAHTVRAGATYNAETATARTRTTVYPLDANGDVLWAPVVVTDDGSDGARLWGVYLQDEWHPLDALTVNYGARYDRYDGFAKEDQFSPRVGLVYEFSPAISLHAGYARYFTPPPSEKIQVASIALFQGTTAAPPSTGNDAVRSERSHYYDVGVLAHVTPVATLGLDAYYRKVAYLGDEGQFGPAVIFAPFNYAEGRIWGVELSTGWHESGSSAYLNVAYGSARGRQIVSGQYNFDSDELAALALRYIPLDHDQRWTVSAGLTHLVRGTTFSVDGLFGSGLRRGFLNADHLPSYLTLNLSARHTLDLPFLGALEASVSLLNVLDHVYELRDGSGVGVGAPQWGARRTLFVGVGHPFGR
ncbi:MAG: TonB-dependent receptor [Pseudomonadota bacterium]